LFASTNYSEWISNLKNRKLLVITEEFSEKESKGFSENQLSAYKYSIESYNRKLKEIMESFWQFNDSIRFLTWKEAMSIEKSTQKEYLIYYAVNYWSEHRISDQIVQRSLIYTPTIFSKNEKRDYPQYFTSFNLAEFEKLGKDKFIFSRSIANLWPLKGDMIFSAQFMQDMLESYQKNNNLISIQQRSNENDGVLKSAVLSFETEHIFGNSINVETLKNTYPYEFQILSHDSLISKMVRKENIVYLQIVPTFVSTIEAYRMSYDHILIHAKTGKIVSYIPPDGGILHATMGFGEYHKYVSAGIVNEYIGNRSKIYQKE
jgi:hypothetical protein